MKYTFSNTEYLWAHRKNPRGKGYWGFIVMDAALSGITPNATVIHTCSGHEDTLFFIPGAWTLTEAKKRAEVLLAANAVSNDTIIYVAP